MKKYIIWAKRNDETEWTPWADTNDIMGIERFVNRVRELGYDALVTDHALIEFEKKLSRGYLIETPFAIGQTVYTVTDKDPHIEEWVVKELHYDGENWVAIDTLGISRNVSKENCFYYRRKAERLLKKIKGVSEDET